MLDDVWTVIKLIFDRGFINFILFTILKSSVLFFAMISKICEYETLRFYLIAIFKFRGYNSITETVLILLCTWQWKAQLFYITICKICKYKKTVIPIRSRFSNSIRRFGRKASITEAIRRAINVANPGVTPVVSNARFITSSITGTIEWKRISSYGNIYTPTTVNTIDVGTHDDKVWRNLSELYMLELHASCFSLFSLAFLAQHRSKLCVTFRLYKSMRDTWMWHSPTCFEFPSLSAVPLSTRRHSCLRAIFVTALILLIRCYS